MFHAIWHLQTSISSFKRAVLRPGYRAQFFAQASKKKPFALLAFAKDSKGKGLDGETDLWRELNFVTSAELYQDGPPNRE